MAPVPSCSGRSPLELTLDRLPEPGPSLEVAIVENESFGADSARGARRPHRHDYHELIWSRGGSGEQLIDGEPLPVAPHTVTLIGRGQVHVLQRARGLSGAVVRFGEEVLHREPGARAHPGWLLGHRGALSVTVPADEVPRLDSLIEALAAEMRRPPDERSLDLQRHFVWVLLLWIDRWYESAHAERPDAGAAEVKLYRRFAHVLERDFARHHKVRHYADALGVPQSVLSRALTQVTGRGTKELVTDRRMLEAARLLRFTDLTVGEVAYQAGFDDQLYFSRAFKRHYGETPTTYRERLRGRPAAPAPEVP